MESELSCSLPEQKAAQKRPMMGEKETKESKQEKKGKSLPVLPGTKNTVQRVCVPVCVHTGVCARGEREWRCGVGEAGGENESW